MTSYNAAVGFELGDLLLRHLSTILRAATHGAQRTFVGHYGEDRFLIIAPTGALSGFAEEIILRFDRASIHFAHQGEGGANAAPGPSGPLDQDDDQNAWLEPPSLRVLVLPGIFRHIRSARDLRRLALRCRDEKPDASLGCSRIIVHEHTPDAAEPQPSTEAA